MRDKIKNNARTSALKGIAGFAVILFTGLLGVVPGESKCRCQRK